MTKDDILMMAREAGMEVHELKGQVRIGSAVLTGCDSTKEVTKFAALVAAKAAAEENEACALICDEIFDKSATIEVLKASRKIRARQKIKEQSE